jgi:Ca2+-binding RTX toxin-like protein
MKLTSWNFATYNFGLYIDGTEGADSLWGTDYADEIHGRGGNDWINGGAGDDLLFGEDGDDTLLGGAGNDVMYGGNGNDTFNGGSGDDIADGGAGNDLFYGNAGADQHIGGDGFDTINYSASSTLVIANLAAGYGQWGDAHGDTYSGIDKVIGSAFGDIMIADNSGVVFEGGAGNDDLLGGSGLDVLNGGTGNDWIKGGLGLDILTGGAGADHFEFDWGDGPDLIYDFQPGVDKIALNDGFYASGYFATFGRDGQLATGTELPDYAGHHNQPGRDWLFYDTDDHQLWQLSPVYGGVGAELLATFANGVQLQTSDFVFV